MPDQVSLKPLPQPPDLEDNNGSIRVRFTYAGKRRTIGLGGRWNDPLSMKSGQKVADEIYADTHRESFDFTHLKYKGFIDREQLRKQEEKDRDRKRRDIERAQEEFSRDNKPAPDPSDYFKKQKKRHERELEHLRKLEEEQQNRENPPFLPLWDEWLNTLDLPVRTKEKHYDAIRRMAEKAGNPRLRELSWFVDAQLYYSTFNQRRSYLVRFYSWLLEEKAIDAQFKLKSRSQAHEENLKEEEVPFTKGELRAIINAFRTDQFCPKKSAFKHSHYADYVEFCILTASRPQEAIGLRWKDVDFTHHRLIIPTALARQDKGPRKRKELKAGNIKVLPLKSRLLELLSIRKPEDPHPESLVFPGTKGKPIDDTNFRDRQWIPVLNGLKIEYRRFYNIRHSVLTLVVKETGNLMEAAKLAGHRNLKMVTERYGHLIGDTQTFEL